MVLNVNATTTLLAKAAPGGVTATVLLDKSKTKEQKIGTIAGMGVATSVSSTLQGCTRQAVEEKYFASLTDEQLAYVCELMDEKEKELSLEELGVEMTNDEMNMSASDEKTFVKKVL